MFHSDGHYPAGPFRSACSQPVKENLQHNIARSISSVKRTRARVTNADRERFRALSEAGWTHAAIAAETGFGQTTVSRYLRAERPVAGDLVPRTTHTRDSAEPPTWLYLVRGTHRAKVGISNEPERRFAELDESLLGEQVERHAVRVGEGHARRLERAILCATSTEETPGEYIDAELYPLALRMFAAIRSQLRPTVTQ